MSQGSQRWVVLGALGIVTVLAVLDAVTSFTFYGALVIGPLLAAVVAPPAIVAGVAGYTVAWALVLGTPEHFSGPHLLRIGLVVAGGGLAVVLATMRVTREAALTRALRVAEAAQQALLRPVPERVGSTDLAVRYVSAFEGAVIGGDLYDAVETPWGLRVIVGDVCGKGLDAVGLASVVLGAFRQSAPETERLDDVVAAIDRALSRDTRNSEFATAVVVELRGAELRLANCGHPDPIRVGERGIDALAPDRRSPPLGLSPSPGVVRVGLVTGERVLLYTDGLTEARDPDGTFFDAVPAVSGALRGPDLDRSLDELLGRVADHVDGPLRDDLVVLALAYRG